MTAASGIGSSWGDKPRARRQIVHVASSTFSGTSAPGGMTCRARGASRSSPVLPDTGDSPRGAPSVSSANPKIVRQVSIFSPGSGAPSIRLNNSSRNATKSASDGVHPRSENSDQSPCGSNIAVKKCRKSATGRSTVSAAISRARGKIPRMETDATTANLNPKAFRIPSALISAGFRIWPSRSSTCALNHRANHVAVLSSAQLGVFCNPTDNSPNKIARRSSTISRALVSTTA